MSVAAKSDDPNVVNKIGINPKHIDLYILFYGSLLIPSVITTILIVSLLIYGAWKQRRDLLLPWIIYKAISVCVCLIAIVVSAIILKQFAVPWSLIIALSKFSWLLCYCVWKINCICFSITCLLLDVRCFLLSITMRGSHFLCVLKIVLYQYNKF